MKRSTREWVEKAESDYQAAMALNRRRKVTFHDEVCFHCQQSGEKYLKAVINEAGQFIPKTHDMVHLLGLLASGGSSWAPLAVQASQLTLHAVRIRYPGMKAGPLEAKQALKDTRQLRKAARKSLGL